MPSRGFINLLGPLFTRAFKPGASEVKSDRLRTATDSSVRVTMFTPTSGTRIRIISVQIGSTSSTIVAAEMYFATGANITTNAGKEIVNTPIDADPAQSFRMVWPDGGGPIGAVDEVLSYRTSADITTSHFVLVHYREE